MLFKLQTDVAVNTLHKLYNLHSTSQHTAESLSKSKSFENRISKLRATHPTKRLLDTSASPVLNNNYCCQHCTHEMLELIIAPFY